MQVLKLNPKTKKKKQQQQKINQIKIGGDFF